MQFGGSGWHPDGDAQAAQFVRLPELDTATVEFDDLPDNRQADAVPFPGFVQPCAPGQYRRARVPVDSRAVILDHKAHDTCCSECEVYPLPRPLGGILEQVSRELKHVLLVQGQLILRIDNELQVELFVAMQLPDDVRDFCNIGRGPETPACKCRSRNACTVEFAVDEAMHALCLFHQVRITMFSALLQDQAQRCLECVGEVPGSVARACEITPPAREQLVEVCNQRSDFRWHVGSQGLLLATGDTPDVLANEIEPAKGTPQQVLLDHEKEQQRDRDGTDG